MSAREVKGQGKKGAALSENLSKLAKNVFAASSLFFFVVARGVDFRSP
jgi:hypothetical protein